MSAATWDEEIAAARARLLDVAYRMTGSVADAEDLVQETWLAVRDRPIDEIDDPRAYLVRTVARRSLNRLREIARRRESYTGEWLPEPIVADDRSGPDVLVELGESVAFAMLVVLDAMTPLERAAFVLCEAFGMAAADVGAMMDRSPEAVRQLAARGRRRARELATEVGGEEAASGDEVLQVGAALLTALSEGDVEGVLALLAPDVQFVSDGGGVVTAAIIPVLGADKVSRLLFGLLRKDPDARIEPRLLVNGIPGILVTETRGDRSLIQLAVRDGRITRVWSVRNPAKLGAVR